MGEDQESRDKRRSSSSCENTNNSRSFLKSYGLEICCLFFSIGSSNSQLIVQNFYIDRICRIEKNFSSEECRNMSSGFYERDGKKRTFNFFACNKNLFSSRGVLTFFFCIQYL